MPRDTWKLLAWNMALGEDTNDDSTALMVNVAIGMDGLVVIGT